MNPATTIDQDDATVLALAALAWLLEEPQRADRLLALTGLGPDDLRARLGERPVQAAVLGFLEHHEPDLVACADALRRRPDELVAARAALEQGA